MAPCTLGICTFNRCRLLKEALRSFLRLPGLGEAISEFVICLNGCTDESNTVVETLRPEFESANVTLKVYSTKTNRHPSIVYNELAAHGSTDYIWFFSDDDIIAGSPLSKLCAATSDKHNCAIYIDFERREADLVRTILKSNFKADCYKRYHTLNEFLSKSDPMGLSFISGLIVKRTHWVKAAESVAGQWIDTNYQHVFILLSFFGNLPFELVGPPYVVNRYNYRSRRDDTSPDSHLRWAQSKVGSLLAVSNAMVAMPIIGER